MGLVYAGEPYPPYELAPARHNPRVIFMRKAGVWVTSDRNFEFALGALKMTAANAACGDKHVYPPHACLVGDGDNGRNACPHWMAATAGGS
jgi:hypothetical protein